MIRHNYKWRSPEGIGIRTMVRGPSTGGRVLRGDRGRPKPSQPRVPEYNRRMSDQSPPRGQRAFKFVTLCGRTFHNTDPQYFPRAEYRGRLLYFCTDSCLGAFRADPARFYVAHRRSAHKSGPRFN